LTAIIGCVPPLRGCVAEIVAALPIRQSPMTYLRGGVSVSLERVMRSVGCAVRSEGRSESCAPAHLWNGPS
jgi:hypothetical protein